MYKNICGDNILFMSSDNCSALVNHLLAFKARYVLHLFLTQSTPSFEYLVDKPMLNIAGLA